MSRIFASTALLAALAMPKIQALARLAPMSVNLLDSTYLFFAFVLHLKAGH
jgi:hypothetical protein